MIKIRKVLSSIALLLFSTQLVAQITIKSHPFDKSIVSDSVFFGSERPRTVKLLSDNWRVYPEGKPEQKQQISIPATFEGNETLVYENSIYVSKDEVNNNSIKLGFLGLNHTSEISLNDYSIYKKTGEIPFEIELPKDILKPDAKNKISIKINSDLNSDNTIPVLQRFLFPKVQNGITRDVYLKIEPKVNISKLSISTKVNENLSIGKIHIGFALSNLNSLKKLSESGEQMFLRISVYSKAVPGSEQNYDISINQFSKAEFETGYNLDLQNPLLWSPATPSTYLCNVKLFCEQRLLDADKREISFLQLSLTDQNLYLNKQPFVLQGTTYYINESELSYTNVYQKITADLKLIKETGFNAVRFPKAFPNPYALKICQELGLLALVELPLNSIPEELLSKNEFQLQAQNKLKDLVESGSRYSSALIFGLGGSYLPNSTVTENFISKLSGQLSESGFNSYTSFYGIQKTPINNLDFYGIELMTRTSDDAREFLAELNDAKYFISEINYPKYVGSASGYLVQNSEEAQAKYFESIIDMSAEKKFSGFFVNTLFNYTGDYKSLFAGYTSNNSYSLGVLINKRLSNSLPYKVLKSKLLQEGKVTIPIGSRKDENKLVFILMALALSIMMAILINSKKKFREDCSRALIRPYNFYADIRDNRILSSVHTFILLLVETGSASLFLVITLFYLRTNVLLEKILLSFGDTCIINSVSYLAWHPEQSLVYIFVGLLLLVGLLTVTIKIVSYSIKTRVESASIFYSIVWALLPFTLLLPVELILYKILAAYGVNIYALVFFLVFWLWILQRIIKGVHVIFDVRPMIVYVYSFLTMFLIIGGILFYYQLTNSTLFYLSNTFKQYSSMPF
jgi:beta-galactosidase